MKRLLFFVMAFIGPIFVIKSPVIAHAATARAGIAQAGIKATFTGSVVYVNPAGMEPDFDLINRVIIETRVRTNTGLPMTLILDAYLENFQPDTQPVLPDLTNQKVALSTTLGGFFSGKAIVVGPGNRVLFVGSMLAEALIRPYCLGITGSAPPALCRTEIQHMIVSLIGQGAAKGGYMGSTNSPLKSVFTANQRAQVHGVLYGPASIPARAQRLMRQGTGNLTIAQILHDFQVPHPIMRGGPGSGKQSRGYCFRGHCTNRPVKGGSGKGSGSGSSGHSTAGPTSSRPAWMAPTGVALIVVAIVLLGWFFREQRRVSKTGLAKKTGSPTIPREVSPPR